MTEFISEDEATGKVKEIFKEINAFFGMVPNFFKAQAGVDRTPYFVPFFK